MATLTSEARLDNAGVEVPAAGDAQGNALVAYGAAPYQNLTRRSEGWSVMNTAALAALVVRPSTVAQLTLWNGEPYGGKSYVMDRAFAHMLVSAATEGRFGMWLTVHPQGMAKPTADITAIKGYSGRSSYGGEAVVDTGATVLDDGWFIWGAGNHSETSDNLPGSHMAVNLEGRLLVPPQGGISLQMVAQTVTSTFTSGFSWYEVQLDHA